MGKMPISHILTAVFAIILIVIIAKRIIYAVKNRETQKENERMQQTKIHTAANTRDQDMLTGKPNHELVKIHQKKETKEIIKGAVSGEIIGDAGAVVGAMVAKKKINNEKK